MTGRDPAIEAAQRAWVNGGWGPEPLALSEGSLAIDAAREALAPVRLWYESNKEFLDVGYPISLDGLAKLIYREDEL